MGGRAVARPKGWSKVRAGEYIRRSNPAPGLYFDCAVMICNSGRWSWFVVELGMIADADVFSAKGIADTKKDAYNAVTMAIWDEQRRRATPGRAGESGS